MPGRDSIETKCQLLKQALEPEIVDPSDNDKKNRHTPTIRNELLAHIKEIQGEEKTIICPPENNMAIIQIRKSRKQ